MAPPLSPDEPAVTTANPIKAQLSWLGVTGSFRTGYWSSNRLYDDASGVGTASAWLKLEKKLDNGIGLFAEGYSAREDFRTDGNTRANMREMYVETRKGDFDFRVGRQIIAWGRTDRLNPTDNLTPRDARLLATDIDEDRFGSLAAKASWSLTANDSLTLVLLPEFQANKSYSKFTEVIPSANNQWAIKYDQSGKAIDWSVSYYDGYDLSPDLSASYVYKHYRTKVYGMDIATTVGSNRFALESAYTQTQDMNGTNEYIKNPFLYTVFGVEHDFGNNTSGIVQIFNRHVYNYSYTYVPAVAGDTTPLPFQYQVYGNRPNYFGYDNLPFVSPNRAVTAWRQNPALFTQTAAQRVTAEVNRINGSDQLRETITAGYLQGEIRLFNRLQLLTGVRYEKVNDKGTGSKVSK